MILSISLARNAVFVDVTGCPCAPDVACELLRRYGEAGLGAFAGSVGSSVALHVDTIEPKDEAADPRVLWHIQRCFAAGIAVVWALENGAVVAAERREEPLADAGGVFGVKGWEAHK